VQGSAGRRLAVWRLVYLGKALVNTTLGDLLARTDVMTCAGAAACRSPVGHHPVTRPGSPGAPGDAVSLSFRITLLFSVLPGGGGRSRILAGVARGSGGALAALHGLHAACQRRRRLLVSRRCPCLLHRVLACVGGRDTAPGGFRRRRFASPAWGVYS